MSRSLLPRDQPASAYDTFFTRGVDLKWMVNSSKCYQKWMIWHNLGYSHFKTPPKGVENWIAFRIGWLMLMNHDDSSFSHLFTGNWRAYPISDTPKWLMMQASTE